MVYCVLVTQSCPTLCTPMDCSPPSSSVHGIFQARILEWAAISFTSNGLVMADKLKMPKKKEGKKGAAS